MFTVVRPEVHNALDLETINALDRFVTWLEEQPEIIAVVIAGEGQSFIAGGDLVEFSRLRGESAGRALSARVQAILRRLAALPQVSIAALSGHAYGGGVELALACDLRIVERAARIGLTQAKFGLTTAWGGTARLVHLVGYSVALDLLLNRRVLGGEEAFRMGLSNRLTEDGLAVAAAQEMAQDIALLGRDLVAGVKRLARASIHGGEADVAADETSVFGRLWASEKHEMLVRSFLEGG